MEKVAKVPNIALRFQREKRGWSQKKIADLLDTSKEMISRWECGKRLPSKYYQERLCHLFEMSADELGFVCISPSRNSPHSSQIKHMEGQDTINPIRRTLLSSLVGLASTPMLSREWFEHTINTTSTKQGETNGINTIEQCIENGWELCNSGEWQVAEHVLHSFLPQLLQQAPTTPLSARLAAQALVLQSILRAHQLRLAAMIPLCKQAVLYARFSGDMTTLCMALVGLAVSYKYNKQAQQSLTTYQEALQYCSQASPLVRSRTFAGAASAYAIAGQYQLADTLIQSAYECYPEDSTQDPRRLSADHGGYLLAYYGGLIALETNQPQKALQAFESYKTMKHEPDIPQRNHLEILNQMGKAAIALGDLELYSTYLHASLRGAIELQSKKRLDEAANIFFQDMPTTWRTTQPIQCLVDQYPVLVETMR